jgi:cytochrome P450
MSEANSMPDRPADDLGELERVIAEHLARAEPGSLASRFAGAPADERTAKVGQVPHWLFACGDTLAINALRGLALLGADRELLDRSRADRAYLGAALQEAMRLWPTTTMLSRVTTAETELRGEMLPAGTQVVIVNSYGHRDRERVKDADRVVPGRWLSGDAAAYAGFNHFSRGPQGCPGQALSLAIGEVLIGTLIDGFEPHLDSPSIDPADPLPHMLDFFGIRIELVPR